MHHSYKRRRDASSVITTLRTAANLHEALRVAVAGLSHITHNHILVIMITNMLQNLHEALRVAVAGRQICLARERIVHVRQALSWRARLDERVEQMREPYIVTA